jgi:hypothetical protein
MVFVPPGTEHAIRSAGSSATEGRARTATSPFPPQNCSASTSDSAIWRPLDNKEVFDLRDFQPVGVIGHRAPYPGDLRGCSAA